MKIILLVSLKKPFHGHSREHSRRGEPLPPPSAVRARSTAASALRVEVRVGFLACLAARAVALDRGDCTARMRSRSQFSPASTTRLTLVLLASRSRSVVTVCSQLSHVRDSVAPVSPCTPGSSLMREPLAEYVILVNISPPTPSAFLR